MEEYVCIPTERYEELIRAERDANMVKALIAHYYEGYHPFDRGVLTIMYTMFIGKKEE